MPKTNTKLNKKLKKVKEMHPYSRKSFKIRGAFLREDRLQKDKKNRQSIKVNPLVDRFLFFKFAMDPDLESFTFDQMRDLIDLWLSRYQEELTNSAMEQTSHGRATQHAPMKPRDVLLKALVEKEREDYRKFGLAIPDLTCPETVKFLSKWEGDFNQLSLIKLITIKPLTKSSKQEE